LLRVRGGGGLDPIVPRRMAGIEQSQERAR